MRTTICLKNENHGEWGNDLLLPLVRKALPPDAIITIMTTDHITRPDLIIRATHHAPNGWDENDSRVPYITFSGEPYMAGKRPYEPICSVETVDFDNESVWIPYFLSHPIPITNDGMKRLFNSNDKERGFAVYVSSNCCGHRDQMFQALHRLHPETCHARGSCCNNYNRAHGGWTDVVNVYSEYTFVLAMENHDLPGYITEKIINAYMAGAIPIYWGTRAVHSIFNPSSFVYVNDFNSFDQCAQYVVDLYMDKRRLREMKNAPIFKSPETQEDWYSFMDGRSPSERYKRIIERIQQALL